MSFSPRCAQCSMRVAFTTRTVAQIVVIAYQRRHWHCFACSAGLVRWCHSHISRECRAFFYATGASSIVCCKEQLLMRTSLVCSHWRHAGKVGLCFWRGTKRWFKRKCQWVVERHRTLQRLMVAQYFPQVVLTFVEPLSPSPWSVAYWSTSASCLLGSTYRDQKKKCDVVRSRIDKGGDETNLYFNFQNLLVVVSTSVGSFPSQSGESIQGQLPLKRRESSVPEVLWHYIRDKLVR